MELLIGVGCLTLALIMSREPRKRKMVYIPINPKTGMVIHKSPERTQKELEQICGHTLDKFLAGIES